MNTHDHAAYHDRRGMDVDWVLTAGAEMAWHYGFAVQSRLVDMEAAYTAGDWPTCVAACVSALRAMAECEYRGAGASAAVPEAEMQLRLATDPSPLAEALRAMPPAGSATQAAAEQSMGTVREHDERLRGSLPFDVPVLRSPAGPTQSMRLSAALLRHRKVRGLGTTGS